MQPIIEANFEKGSEIHSDELRSYKGLDQKGYEHETVNHSAGQYADLVTGCPVNGVENFWSHLKKAINGTHVHVSKEYLANYVAEFEYRFNFRQAPQLMFDELISSFSSVDKVSWVEQAE